MMTIHQETTSTHQSIEVITSINSEGDEEIIAIESSIEQVAAMQNSNSTTRTTRARFNSIGDALGNLRSRLREAHHRHSDAHNSSAPCGGGGGGSGGGDGQSARGSWLQRLSDRLSVVNAAHSSRAPLHVVESRRTQSLMIRNTSRGEDGGGNGTAAAAGGSGGSGAGSAGASGGRRGSAPPAPPLRAAARIFSICTQETVRYEETPVPAAVAASSTAAAAPATAAAASASTASPTTTETSSAGVRPTFQRRSSVLFASRIVASRSITEGASHVLLASGGQGSHTYRRDLLRENRLGSARGSLRNFEMHVHRSISMNMLSPISDWSDYGSSATPASKRDSFKVKESMTQDDAMMDVEGDGVHKEVQPAGADDMMVVDGSDTRLYSWGRGEQSLHDDPDSRTVENGNDTPLRVTSRLGSKSIIAVAAGPHHSAAATSKGALYAVGMNTSGCIDPNSPVGKAISRPMLLDCISHVRVVQVSCGLDHTAVLSSNGSILTWGSNEHGQLGHRIGNHNNIDSKDWKGSTNCRPTGMVLGKGRRASSVAAGTGYTLVLTQHMSLLACGVSSIAGHCETSARGLPREIPSLIGLPLAQASAGDAHAAVLTAHGTCFVWGENQNGCCARDYPKKLSLPVPVKVPVPPPTIVPGHGEPTITKNIVISHVSCGLEHTVFVTQSGSLLVCGSNYGGQLGLAASKQQSTSKLVTVVHPGGGKFIAAEAGNAHSLLLDSAGEVWATNANDGLTRVLEVAPAMVIAAGGDGNCIAISSAPGGARTLKRQFSIEIPEDNVPIMDSVDNLLEAMETDDACTAQASLEIADMSEELLGHPPMLNLIRNPMKLEAMFERLMRAGDVALRQTIANAIERGMKAGLESLRGSRMMYPEAARCLLSYIKFFDIHRDKEIVFDTCGQAIFMFCETILGIPFEGNKALHDFATLYPKELFVKMLVRPLLLALNACLAFTVDDNNVQHFNPSRQAVPVIVAVLSWLHFMGEEAGLAEATDFYSDGVSSIDVESLFEDLYQMKKASPHEKSKNFYLCAHPFLLSPGCKRNLLQMESRVEQFKAMMNDADISGSLNQVKVDPFYHLEIERKHLVEQTLEKIKDSDPKNLRKRLRVAFKGEEGVDAGGVTKEFFQLLCLELFDPHSGLWTDKYGDKINWFNSDNTWDEKGFDLIGVLFGLALYNSVLLDVRFPLAVYRKILGLPLGLEDIMDEELRRGLKHLLDYEGDDVEDIFCLTFEVTWMEMGEERRLELKPDGSNIPVTNENKEEYVLRYVRWILVDSIQPQWDAFQTGLMRVMEDSSLDLFLPEELELLVVGSAELDFSALETNTSYEGGYEKASEAVKCFWRFVNEATPEEQEQLLKFVTASTKAPIGGLGKMDFVIQRAGPDSQNLPTSHTCFNTLLLPDYGSDYEKMKSLLGRAILECEGFGLE